MTPELEPFIWSVRHINGGTVPTYRTAGIKDLDSVKLGLLGYTVGLGSNSTGTVGTVTVAISVLAVTRIVGQESSATLKLGVRGVNTSVDDIGAGTGTGGAIIGVGSGTTGYVRDTSEAPSGRRLGNIGLLVEVRGVGLRELAQVGLDNSILLDVVDL
jgi:hypothetical protein